MCPVFSTGVVLGWGEFALRVLELMVLFWVALGSVWGFVIFLSSLGLFGERGVCSYLLA